jgi:cytochrome c553
MRRLAVIGASLFLLSPAAAEETGALIAECAACHGEDGVARDSEVPHLAGQNERYLALQLEAFRSGKRRHPDMRSMSRRLTDADIAALAAHYAGLPPR